MYSKKPMWPNLLYGGWRENGGVGGGGEEKDNEEADEKSGTDANVKQCPITDNQLPMTDNR